MIAAHPPVTYVVMAEASSPRFGAAFAAGCNGPISAKDELRDGAVALFGSPARWDLLGKARAAGRDWYYGDHPYLGRVLPSRRGSHFRITRNAFQPAAVPPRTREAEARLAALNVEILPWRTDGRHVLICPPGPVYAHLMRRAGVPIEGPDDWGSWAAARLRRYTDRPLRFRSKGDAQSRPLAADLAGCWALVTFMSNVAVEAALAGVPVFVLGPAAARCVGTDDLARIEHPVFPERYDFACGLAAQQWSLQEIAAGKAWEALRV